ncbi:FecR family protein [Asticcacaulis solisilvae]|uniref:FecR family protein n=1 Tax=Asticcacaulis solisilvae TaxID=1217274 RepID=UPI003FD82B69
MPASSETSEQIEAAAAVWAMKDRPLSAGDDAQLRDWLAGDPRRRGALLRAQATLSSLDRAQALGAGVHRETKKPFLPVRLSRRDLLIASGAASGLSAAGLAGFFIGRRNDKAATAVGEIRRMPMSDGSIATINTDSAIQVDMTATHRVVDLVRGEAWFKVARNKKRPFVVMAGLARVQAVGTAFSVRRLDTGTEVQVTEGTVKAWLEDGDKPAIWLNAGDTAVLTPQGHVTRDHAPQAIEDALAWREGQIALTGQSLGAAAAEYNRYNQTKIVIQDPELAGEHLLGRFNADDPEGFSNAIAVAFDADIRHVDKTIYIGKKN